MKTFLKNLVKYYLRRQNYLLYAYQHLFYFLKLLHYIIMQMTHFLKYDKLQQTKLLLIFQLKLIVT